MNIRRLELVKWLAFVAMVADHVDLVLFSRSVHWLHEVGQFAFPAFCVCFGVGLAHTRGALNVAVRLIVPALLAALAWFFIDPAHPPLNVLHMFAVCAALHWVSILDRRIGAAFWVCIVALALVTPVVEGGPFGPLMVLAGLATARWGSIVTPCLLMPWMLLAPSVGAVAAAAAPAIAENLAPELPRHGGALMWAYPAHLGLLLLLRPLLA